MNIRLLSVLCTAATIFGICLYAYFNEWIILRNPWRSPYHTQLAGTHLHKKEISLFFWQHESWHTEMVTISSVTQLQEHALTVVQTWLAEAFQRRLLDKPCIAHAALYDARNHCLYLSFSAPVCNPQKSTLEQLQVLESLLKTIRYNMPHDIQSIQFLLNHMIMKHPHLDFTKPIPIVGFQIVST